MREADKKAKFIVILRKLAKRLVHLETFEVCCVHITRMSVTKHPKAAPNRGNPVCSFVYIVFVVLCEVVRCVFSTLHDGYRTERTFHGGNKKIYGAE